ncbi:MAG: acyl-CoA dehydrogenase family protein, partial [Burkholderiales bacterium]
MTEETQELQAMLLHGAAAFLRDRHSLQRARTFRRNAVGFDQAMWTAMAECGWLCICLPEALGGAGLGVGAAAELAARFGSVLLPEPFAQCAVAPSTVLAAAEASPLRDQLAEDLCLGSKLIALAWQHEPGEVEPTWAGAALRSQAGEWVLSGTRVFTEARADCWMVAATMGDGQPCIVAVPAGSDGLALTSQTMGDGTAVATLQLRDIRLPADAILLRGEVARAALTRALDDARLVLSAELAGIAEGALSITAAYVGQRKQFGRTIASFQAVRHRLVDLDLQKRLAFASWRQACGVEGAQRSAAISAAKARCGEAALLATRGAIQLHGAIGYTQEADPGLFLDSALRLASTLGNAPVHRQRFVDHLLAARPASPDFTSATMGAQARPDFAQLADQDFAAYLRGWLREHCPAELRKPVLLRLRGEHERVWLRKLRAHGLRSPGIPSEYGGMGLPLAKQLVYKKVFDEYGVARVLDMGGSLLAPVLIRYGTDEQKAHYLPRILNCDDMWCQGYSEPGSGSDLASLRTSAVRDGDDYVVNGQKIWTSHASTASHIFVLARTRTDGKPQAGISFFLLDLKTPGITVRPIVNLA